jgi:Ser/Thr protein kinase RdoA (MazF antagonist)
MDDPAQILEEAVPSLSHWGVSPASMELVSHSENIVYKVTSVQGDEYAFRVHRPGYHTLAELESEQLWSQALLAYGLRVPRVYPTRTGDHYVAAQCGGTQRYLGLIAWLDGAPMSDVIPICAQFHNQATGWTLPAGFTRHRLDLEGLVGEQPFWGRFWEAPSLTTAERRTIENLREAVARRLSDYGQRPETFGLIHADMHHENLFCTPQGIMVIDFDDAGFGWHLYDFAVALLAHSDRSDFEAIRQAFLDGYLDERPMPEEDLSLLDTFLLARNLATIGWASARPELDGQAYLTYLIDKACRTRLS